MVCVDGIDFIDSVAIDDGVQQLGAFNLDKMRGISPKEYRKRAPDFRDTFIRLEDTIIKDETREIKRRERIQKMAQNPIAGPSASIMVLQEPQTPDRPTHPDDPNYSGSSTESKPEGSPNSLILQFLQDSAVCLADILGQLTWPQTQNIVGIRFL